MGHEDAFLRPRLSARYRSSQGTLAGARGKGEIRRGVSTTGSTAKSALERCGYG